MMMITVSTVPKDITTMTMLPYTKVCKWLRIDHINLHIELDHNQRSMHDDGDLQSHHRLHTQRSHVSKVSTL